VRKVFHRGREKSSNKRQKKSRKRQINAVETQTKEGALPGKISATKKQSLRGKKKKLIS